MEISAVLSGENYVKENKLGVAMLNHNDRPHTDVSIFIKHY